MHLVNDGLSAVGGLTYPQGLLISVPSITIDDLLPWYPTGKWYQFDCIALSGPLIMHPIL